MVAGGQSGDDWANQGPACRGAQVRLQHRVGVGGGPQGKLSMQSFFGQQGWHITSFSQAVQACQRPDELTCWGGVFREGWRKEILGAWQREALVGFCKEEKWPGRDCGCERRRQQWAGRQYLLEVTGRNCAKQTVRG